MVSDDLHRDFRVRKAAGVEAIGDALYLPDDDCAASGRAGPRPSPVRRWSRDWVRWRPARPSAARNDSRKDARSSVEVGRNHLTESPWGVKRTCPAVCRARCRRKNGGLVHVWQSPERVGWAPGVAIPLRSSLDAVRWSMISGDGSRRGRHSTARSVRILSSDEPPEGPKCVADTLDCAGVRRRPSRRARRLRR